MRLSRKLFIISGGVFGGLLLSMLVICVAYRHWYTPLDYRVNSSYPLPKWREHLYTQEGDAKLWGTSGFLGASPYNTTGTVIYKFTYPFKISTVRISDEYTQWGKGDRVTMWTSPDGQSWTLCYEGTEREQVVEYSVTAGRLFKATARYG
jgi:hypothetical protein